MPPTAPFGFPETAKFITNHLVPFRFYKFGTVCNACGSGLGDQVCWRIRNQITTDDQARGEGPDTVRGDEVLIDLQRSPRKETAKTVDTNTGA